MLTAKEKKKIKNIQEIQDNIFRKMPAEKKIRLVSQLFLFSQKLQKLRKQNDPRKSSL
jgi:hypothetical protein